MKPICFVFLWSFLRCAWDCSLLLKKKEAIILFERKCSGDFIALITRSVADNNYTSIWTASERVRGLINSVLNTKTADNGSRMCVMNGPSNPKRLKDEWNSRKIFTTTRHIKKGHGSKKVPITVYLEWSHPEFLVEKLSLEVERSSSGD